MRRIKREEEEGAMGVGTLIVFIAMVLVAAVAASVLISTANKLQQQAQKTGDQAIQEVSTAFSVKDVVIDNTNGNYNQITLRYKLAAGAPEQDLSNTLIKISNSNQSFSVKADSTSSLSIYSEAGVDVSGSTSVLAQGFMAENTMNIYTNGLDNMSTQQDFTIKIIPKHGTPTLEKFSTPPVMSDSIIEVA